MTLDFSDSATMKDDDLRSAEPTGNETRILLAIPTISFWAGLNLREESVAHFVQHGAGRLTRSITEQ